MEVEFLKSEKTVQLNTLSGGDCFYTQSGRKEPIIWMVLEYDDDIDIKTRECVQLTCGSIRSTTERDNNDQVIQCYFKLVEISSE